MRRLATIHFWRRHFWISALMIGAGLLVVFAVAVRTHDTMSFDAKICERIDTLDHVSVAALYRAQVGLSKNAYFKTHPLELAAAQKEIRRQIREFAGATC